MPNFSDSRMFGKPKRDFQRQRVYTAESRIGKGKRLNSVKEMQSFVDSITSTPEFRIRFPRIYSIDVKDGRGCRNALGSTTGWVKMPIWSRCEVIVIHEVAHVVSPWEEHHGPKYCGNYLWLIHKVMGRGMYLELRESFLAHGVKFEDDIQKKDYVDPAKKALEMILAKKAKKQTKETVAC